ncbi:unnamed protein product [Leptosia nina]|uniref:Transcription termination factor 5, mitochondrial n=1 Tax=Leptosia nina TaxID=320188 RepID=A0AAV1JIZ3_9NEOP
MLLQKLLGLRFTKWGQMRLISTNAEDNLSILCKHLKIDKERAKYMQLKEPYISKMTEDRVEGMVKTLYSIGYSRDILVSHPTLFYMLPLTLKNRYRILDECGFQDITPDLLLSYLKTIKQRTIGELKSLGLLSTLVNIENKLASCLSQWPTSLTTQIQGDVNLSTLYTIRLKLIKRYLELMLDLSEEEFYRGMKTYPTIQHRPLKAINETLFILQSQVQMSNEKIKSNMYLIHIDPDNLKNILYYLRTIGGVDIKEVIRMYPKLATRSYTSLLETKKILEKYGIGDEAQSRCLEIYTLSPKTIAERLENTRAMPEFNIYCNHPRFLKIIHYNTTVLKRITNLKDSNKRCLSLNIVSGCRRRYESFQKAPGDGLGKGKDLVFSVNQALGNKFSSQDIRQKLKKHPFWINIPLVEVKYVCDKLLTLFSVQDIYENCPILLYPWNKIKRELDTIDSLKNRNKISHLISEINLTKITKSQKLSIVLYMLEKQHYFSGNGVWTEEQQKNIVHLSA